MQPPEAFAKKEKENVHLFCGYFLTTTHVHPTTFLLSLSQSQPKGQLLQIRIQGARVTPSLVSNFRAGY